LEVRVTDSKEEKLDKLMEIAEELTEWRLAHVLRFAQELRYRRIEQGSFLDVRWSFTERPGS
jgi:hypothetical protein